jgi:hypothetical protein
MAKTNEEFDRIFREKLENHQEKPSALAWERLNNQLPTSKSSHRGIWWAVAASVAVVLVSGWMFWKSSGEIDQKQLLAEEAATTEELASSQETPTSSESIEITALTESTKGQVTQSQPTTKQITLKPNQVKSTQQVERNIPNPSSETEKSQALIAVAEQSSKELQVTTPPVSVEINEATLPAILPATMQQTVAEATPAAEDAPLYRVNIYSDGLKKGNEPDKNLITEMGKTVGKVEGLLGKVDEGFADLQDKKNNLFATLTSRK